MIATLYIPKNTLPHLFDHSENGTTIRLGGNNVYEFKEKGEAIVLTEFKEIDNYIPNFYGDDISLVSAIVGKNGSGKTSLLRQLDYPIDQRSTGIIYVWEELIDGKLQITIVNQTKSEVFADANIIVSNRLESINFLFYSPVIDFELTSTRSCVNPSTKFKSTLHEYYLRTLHQQTLLLGSSILQKIVQTYPDFPHYSSINVKAHNFTKDYFRELYVLANFGNPNRGDALINEIEGELLSVRYDKQEFYRFSNLNYIRKLEGYVKYLRSDSFTDKLNQLWEISDYQIEDKHNKVHNEDHLLKNLEILIFSYLQVGAVFPMIGIGGIYNYDNLINATDFDERLDEFTSQYIVQRSKYISDILKTKIEVISLSNYQELIQIIKQDTFNRIQDIDLIEVKNIIIQNIQDFVAIKKFYHYIKSICNPDNSLVFNLKENLAEFTKFNLRYKEIVSILGHYSKKEVILFDFYPDKNLSNGEKSLLDLFSSFYSYVVQNKGNKQLLKENYALILDEAELGYHPLWKKKFVSAITKVFPLLFSELVPVKYSSETKKHDFTQKNKPIVQIIFSTHDSLTLSDMLFENSVFLDKKVGGKTIISKDKKRTFGANISDLLADSFFVENGLIGEFANDKINETISWLRNVEEITDAEYYKRIIEKIDEPIIQRKLAQMYSEKMKMDLAKILLMKELEEIQNKLNKM